MAAGAGAANFANVHLNRAGVNSLTARATTLLSATTSDVNVTPLAAADMILSLPLENVLPGVPFAVDGFALDSLGNFLPDFNGNVTLSLGNNPAGAAWGERSPQAVDGVVSFSNLTLSQAGSGFTLHAEGEGISPIPRRSTSWPVSWRWSRQPPGTVVVGNGFGFTVAVKDAAGNIDSSFSGNVTAELIQDPTVNSAVLVGPVTVAAASGVATFTDLTVDQAGVFGLFLTSAGIGPAVANAFAAIDVNHAPAFAKGLDQAWLKNMGRQTVAHWATGISAGPKDEVFQNLEFIVTNNNNALFSAQPAVAPDGTLTFTPATGATGVATVTVRLRNDGGTAGGGANISVPQTFTITVSPSSLKAPPRTSRSR